MPNNKNTVPTTDLKLVDEATANEIKKGLLETNPYEGSGYSKDAPPSTWLSYIGTNMRNAQSSSQYDKGFVNSNPGTAEADLRKRRFDQQSNWDKVGNTLVQLGTTTLGMGISGLGALADIPNLLSDADQTNNNFANVITEIGDKIKGYGEEHNPIYTRNNDAFQVSSLSWWLKNTPNIISTLGIMLPALGTLKGASMLGKVLQSGKYLNNPAIKQLGKAMQLDNRISKTVALAGSQRIIENYAESGQVYEDQKAFALNELRDPEKYNNFINSEEGKEAFAYLKKNGLGGMDIHNALAHYVASKSAYQTFNVNSANFAFDILQTATYTKALSKATNTGKRFNKNVLAEANMYRKGEELTKASQVIGKRAALLNAARPYTELALGAASEGIEEIINAIGTGEGMHYGKQMLGTVEDNTFNERLGDYLADPHTWEQGFWGSIGGAVFTAVGQGSNAIENIKQKKNPFSNKQKDAEQIARKITTSNLLAQIKSIDRNINPHTGKPFEGIDPATNAPIEGQEETVQEQKRAAYNKAAADVLTQMELETLRSGNADLYEGTLNSPEFKEHIESQLDSNGTIKSDQIITDLKASFKRSKQYYTAATSIFAKRTDDDLIYNLATGDFLHNKTEADVNRKEAQNYREKHQEDIDNSYLYEELVKKNERKEGDVTPVKDIEGTIHNLAVAKAVTDLKSAIHAEAARMGVQGTEQQVEAFAKQVIDNLESKYKKLTPEQELTPDEITDIHDVVGNLSNALYHEAMADMFDDKAEVILQDKNVTETYKAKVEKHTKAITTAQTTRFNNHIKSLSQVDHNSSLEDVNTAINAVIEERDNITKSNISHWDTNNKDNIVYDAKELTNVATRTINKLKQLKDSIKEKQSSEIAKDKGNEAALATFRQEAGKADVDYTPGIKVGVYSNALKTVDQSVVDGVRKDLDEKLANGGVDELRNNMSSVIEALTQTSDVIRRYYINTLLTEIYGYNPEAPILSDTKADPAVTDALNNLQQTQAAAANTQPAEFSSEIGKDFFLKFDQNTISDKEIIDSNNLFNAISAALGIKEYTINAKGEKVLNKNKITFAQAVTYLINAYGEDVARDKFRSLQRAYKIMSVHSSNNLKVTAANTVNKATFESIRKEVQPFIVDEIEKFSDPSAFDQTGGVNSANIFLGKLQDSIKRTSNGDLQATSAKVSKKLRSLINDLQVGDTVEITVNQDYFEYDEFKNNPEAVPVKITFTRTGKDKVEIGFVNRTDNITHNNIKYTLDGNDYIDDIINDVELQRELETLWQPLKDWYAYASGLKKDNEALKEATKTLLEADKNDVLLSLINKHGEKNTLDDSTVSPALLHIAKVLLYGTNVNNPSDRFFINEIKANLLAWKDKLLRDKINHNKIRKNIEANIEKVLETTISYKSFGDIVKSVDSNGNIIYRSITEVIDNDLTNVNLFIRSDESLVSTDNPSDIRHAAKGGFRYQIYIGVESAVKDENGLPKLIPTPLHFNTLNGKRVGGQTERGKQAAIYVRNKIHELAELSRKYNIAETAEQGVILEKIHTVKAELAEVVALANSKVSSSNKPVLAINVDNVNFTFTDDAGNDQEVKYFFNEQADHAVLQINRVTQNYTEDTFTELLGNLYTGLEFKNFRNGDQFTDPVTGKKSTYKEYLIDNNLLVTDVGMLVDNEGKKISNVTVGNTDNKGGSPLIINIDASVANKPITDTKGVSELVTKEKLDKRYSFMYRILDKIIKHNKVKVIQSPNTSGVAEYDPTTKTITLHGGWHNAANINKSLLLAHETIHALLKTTPEGLQVKAHALLRDFRQSILNSVEFIALQNKKDRTIEEDNIIKLFTEYTSNDFEELITYGLTDAAVAKFLNGIKTDKQFKEGVNATMWQELKSIIRDIIRAINKYATKLDELTNIIDQIFEGIDNEITQDSTVTPLTSGQENTKTSDDTIAPVENIPYNITDINNQNSTIDDDELDDLPQLSKFSSSINDTKTLHKRFNNFNEDGKVIRYLNTEGGYAKALNAAIRYNASLKKENSFYKATVSQVAGEQGDYKTYWSVAFVPNDNVYNQNVSEIVNTLPVQSDIETVNDAILKIKNTQPSSAATLFSTLNRHSLKEDQYHTHVIIKDSPVTTNKKILGYNTFIIGNSYFIDKIENKIPNINQDLLDTDETTKDIYNNWGKHLVLEILSNSAKFGAKEVILPYNTEHEAFNNAVFDYYLNNVDNLKITTEEYGSDRSIRIPVKAVPHIQKAEFSNTIITSSYGDKFTAAEGDAAVVVVANRILALRNSVYSKAKKGTITTEIIKKDVHRALSHALGLYRTKRDTDEIVEAKLNSFTDNQMLLNKRILADLNDTNSVIFEKAQRYVKGRYGINLDRIDDFDSDNGIVNHWESTSYLFDDPNDTIADEIKNFLSNIPLADPESVIYDPKTNSVSYNKTKNSLTGFVSFADFKLMNGKLIEELASSTSKEEMLERVRKIAVMSFTEYGKSFWHIYQRLNADEVFFNQFYSNYKKQLTPRYAALFSDAGENIKFQQVLENKAQTKYRLADDYRDGILNKFTAGEFTPQWKADWDAAYINFSKEYRRIGINSDTAVQLSNLYEEMGIEIEPAIFEYYYNQSDSIDYQTKNEEFSNLFLTSLRKIKNLDALTTPMKPTAGMIDRMIANPSEKFEETGNLLRLAEKVAPFTFGKTSFSHRDQFGNIISTPQNPDFLSEWMDKLHQKDDSKVMEFLLPYTKIAANQHSYLLWGNQYVFADEIETRGAGFIDYRIENGKKIPVGINRVNVNKFKAVDLAAIKHTNLGEARDYKSMSESEWDIHNLLVHLAALDKTDKKDNLIVTPAIVPSDRGNIRGFVMDRVIISDKLLTEFKASIGGISKAAWDSEEVEDIRYSTFMKTFIGIAKDEIQAMQTATAAIFEIEPGTGRVKLDANGMPVVRKDAEGQLYYHFMEYDENDNPIYFDEYGNPTGSIFQPHRFGFSNKGEFSSMERLLNIRFNTAEPVADGKSPFVSTILNVNDPDFERRIASRVISHFSEEFNKVMEYYRPYESWLQSIIDDKNKSVLKGYSVERAVAEMVVNHELSYGEQQRLFLGDRANYKSDVDTTKRAGQITASGRVNGLKGTFNGVTIRDIKLRSVVLSGIIQDVATAFSIEEGQSKYSTSRIIAHDEAIKHNKRRVPTLNALEQRIYGIVEPYFDNDSANAVSLITMQEFEKRLVGFGNRDQYGEMIDKLNRGEQLTPSDRTKYIQLQKNFYFDYRYDEKMGKMKPVQVKNAEVVLTPSMIKNLQLQELNDAMIELGIAQLNVESGEKIGTTKIATIHDTNGNLRDNFKDKLSNSITQYHYESLRKQQDNPDHIVDEENKRGVQISKNVINNVPKNHTYKLNGKDIKGAKLIEKLFDLDSKNIKESADKLLARIIDNPDDIEDIVRGNVKAVINHDKLREILIEQAILQNLDEKVIFALGTQIHEDGNLPLYYNTYYKKWQNVLTSLFTNNVTNQKHPGLHAFQMSSMFMQPSDKLVAKHKESTTTVEEETTEPVMASSLQQSTYESIHGAIHGIEYAQHIIERGDYKLRSQRMENGVMKPSEVLLPRSSAKFFGLGGKISIDELRATNPKLLTMLGYRIPTEDKHSLYYFEVVGFLPEDSAAIILPDDFITQTGSDFDIDSVYTMMYNFTRDSQNRLHVTDIDEKDSYRLYNNYFKKILKSDKTKEVISDLSFAVDQLVSDIFDDDIVFEQQAKIDIKTIQHKLVDKGLLMTDVEFGRLKLAQKQELAETLEARQNAILDIYIAIISDPVHTVERVSISSHADLKAARKVVEKALEKGKGNIDVSTYSGQREFRARNMSGKTLKAFAVSRDGLLSIFQQVGAKLSTPVIFTTKVNEIRTRVNILNAYPNAKFETRGDETIAIITLDRLGNNNAGTFTNILGKLITSFSAQFTVNILDGVKDGMPPNINPTTLGWGETLSNAGVLFEETLAFLNLPVIRQITNSEINNRAALRPVFSTGRAKIIARIFTDLYRVASKEKGFTIERIDKALHVTPEIVYPNPNEIEELLLAFDRQPNTLMLLEEMLADIEANDMTTVNSKINALQAISVFTNIDNTTKYALKVTSPLGVDKIGAGPTFDRTRKIQDTIGREIEAFASDTAEIPPILAGNDASLLSSIFVPYKNESTYRPLLSYFKYSNLLAYRTFKGLFISELPWYRETIEQLGNMISDFNSNPRREDQIVTYLNKYLLSSLPFFSIPNEHMEKIIGQGTYTRKRFDFKGQDDITKFKKLNLSNKIILLRKRMLKSGRNLDLHILNYLRITANADFLEKNKYQQIEYRSNDIEELLTASLNDMWYSSDPYERDVARDLVRYAFFVHGFSYSHDSLGRIIPINILAYDQGNDTEIDSEIGIGVTNKLKEGYDIVSGASDNMDISQAAFFDGFNRHIKRFRVSNYKDNAIIPDVTHFRIATTNTVDGQIEKTYEQVFVPDDNNIITINKADFLAATRRSNTEFSYIKITNPYDANDVTVYQRAYDEAESNYYYYYPITKLEPFDRADESIIAANNMPNPNTYLDVISSMANDSALTSEEYTNVDGGIEISSKATIGLGAKLKPGHFSKNLKSPYDIDPRSNVNGVEYPVNPATNEAWIDPKNVNYIRPNKPVRGLRTVFGYSVQAWFEANDKPYFTAEQRIAMYTALLHSKFANYPELITEINQQGGITFLNNSTHQVSSRNNHFLDGKGRKSGYINALMSAYELIKDNTIIEKIVIESTPVAKPPIEIKPPTKMPVYKPSSKIKFVPHPSTNYVDRTKDNASADATIALAIDFSTGGEQATKTAVNKQGKKYIAYDLNEMFMLEDPFSHNSKYVISDSVIYNIANSIVAELNSVKAKSLNIAGNGIYTLHKKYPQPLVDEAVYALLEYIVYSDYLKTPIASIRTGGQTGVDEAGAKAGLRLGIPTTIVAPNNWKFRNKDGVDIANEKEFKARFENTKYDGDVPTPETIAEVKANPKTNHFDQFWDYVKKGTYSQFINDLKKTHTEAEIIEINRKIREVYLEAFNNKFNSIYDDLGTLSLASDGSSVNIKTGEDDSAWYMLKSKFPTINRIMVGNHGIYAELAIPQDKGVFVKKHLQYDEYRKDDMKYYAQTKGVNYADYRPGMWYVDLFEAMQLSPFTQEQLQSTNAYKEANITSKKNKQLELPLEPAKFTSSITKTDNLTNQDLINAMIDNGDLEIVCSGGAKAKNGMFIGSKAFGDWEVVSDLRGFPKHSAGGVDLTVGEDGTIDIHDGESTFKAANGLLITNDVTPPEYEPMSKILTQRNKHLNWVQRALEPDKYPFIKNEDGTVSSHRLVYSTGDEGEAYVYPTIIQQEDGSLKELDENEAWEYARSTKTAMRVPNVKLAEYYSQNGLIKHPTSKVSNPVNAQLLKRVL